MHTSSYTLYVYHMEPIHVLCFHVKIFKDRKFYCENAVLKPKVLPRMWGWFYSAGKTVFDLYVIYFK